MISRIIAGLLNMSGHTQVASAQRMAYPVINSTNRRTRLRIE
jgi:hypothetical protein